MDPYAVLDLPRSATLKEVKAAYKQLALTYHPDRMSAATRLNLGGTDPAVAFSRISEAYSILVDEYKRTRFHAMNSMMEEDIAKLCDIKRRNALLDVELMRETLRGIVSREWQKQGVVIVRALYGEMPERVDMYRTLREQAFGEVIDVTKPVQYLVHESKILIPAGNSKVMLKGFYDPVSGYPKVLAIRYMFRNQLHQAVVNDFDRVRLPMRAHLMPNDCQALVSAEMDTPLMSPGLVSPHLGGAHAPTRATPSFAPTAFATPKTSRAFAGEAGADAQGWHWNAGSNSASPVDRRPGKLWTAGVAGTLQPSALEERLSRRRRTVSKGTVAVGLAAVAAVVGISRPDLVKALAAHVRDGLQHGKRAITDGVSQGARAMKRGVAGVGASMGY